MGMQKMNAEAGWLRMDGGNLRATVENLRMNLFYFKSAGCSGVIKSSQADNIMNFSIVWIY